VAWLLFKPPADLARDERAFVAELQAHSPPLATATALAQQFRDMVRQRKAKSLESWINEALASDLIEMRRFADGLRQDQAAVEAALSLPWSNGQTEGHVNRLKTIKRQMYGRASFHVLRQRVLWAG
jgi:transposase